MVAVVGRQRKRRTTALREQTMLTVADADTPAKRRRVQHNYRRLSRAGYIDDDNGRQRFNGKKTAATAGATTATVTAATEDSLSFKSKAADPGPGPSTSKVTRSRAKPDTVAGEAQGQSQSQDQCVADSILYFWL